MNSETRHCHHNEWIELFGASIGEFDLLFYFLIFFQWLNIMKMKRKEREGEINKKWL